jgi:glycine cleavage system H protein
MPQIRGCDLPDDLLYDVENNIWYRENDDGTVTLGMTTVAAAMAGPLVAFTPKKAGRSVKEGKSCATIESGKWVGPAKIAFEAEIAAVNDNLAENPKIAGADPYGEGWMVKVTPADWSAAKATLTPGTDVAAPYEAKMVADEFAGCEELSA